jgi:two-component system cell cycle sensor histidine kinase/response regulator CckA
MFNEIRVLVLDDEIPVLSVLTDFLKGQGYAVYPVLDPEVAMARIGSGMVDLAIIDVGAHGLRVAREAATRNIPSILMSGRPVIFEIGGIGNVLQKPFKLDELASLIAKTVAGYFDPTTVAARIPL